MWVTGCDCTMEPTAGTLLRLGHLVFLVPVILWLSCDLAEDGLTKAVTRPCSRILSLRVAPNPSQSLEGGGKV